MNATATAEKKEVKQTVNPRLLNLGNGSYLKGKICGVNSREVNAKNDPTKKYVFHTLIMETSLTAQKIYVNLRGKSIDNNHLYHQRFDEYVGKTCMLNVLYAINRYTKDGNQVSNLEITYFGEEPPIFFDSNGSGIKF